MSQIGRDFAARTRLRGLGYGFIHQQNRDIVPDGIDPATLPTLQALAVVLERQWLLAHRADQDFQQVLGNHDRSILRLRRVAG